MIMQDVHCVYIAGPMRNHVGFNFGMFEEADKVVRSHFGYDEEGQYIGVSIANPAYMDIERSSLEDLALTEGWEAAGIWLQNNPSQDTDIRVCLREDTTWISHYCTDIVMLPGWEKSLGALAEKALAEAVGATVWYLWPETREISQFPRDVVSPFGERRTTSSTGGQKGVKLARFDLVPRFPLLMLAEHYGRGAAKYADHQWRAGYEFSKSIAAHDRHEALWLMGEDYDVCTGHENECSHVDMDGNAFEAPPSPHGPTCFNHIGSHHLDAMNWHGFFLREMTKYHPEFDDRYQYGEDNEDA